LIKVGILNLTEHLDETVEGFKNSLEQYGIEPHYIYFNAQGKENRLAGYAKKILNEGVDIVFACSTPSALAMKDSMQRRQVPVVYAPVFNPHLAGLVNPDDGVLRNFTGVSGMIAPSLKINMMQRVFMDLTKIAVFFDSEDQNSVYELENLKDTITGKLLDCEAFPLSGGKLELDLLDKMHDPVLLAFSMKIEEHIENWINEAVERSVPVVASSKRGAVLGCLAGLYADHYQLGTMAAHKAKKILQGRGVSEIGISYPDECKVVCNYMTATRLNFDFPPELSMAGDIC
jgi:putative ABC transport system substrate-binding protein